MRSFLLVGAIVLSAFGSAQTILKDPKAERRLAFWKSIGNTKNAKWRAAAKLKAGRPVNDLQASLLATAYFDAYISGCGSSGMPEDKGSYWLFRSRRGYDGTPGPKIRVDKRTGATSSEGRITVRDLSSYSKFVRK